jgi:hypothetical protein
MIFDLRLAPTDGHVFVVEPETPKGVVHNLKIENPFDEEVFHVGVVDTIRFDETLFNDISTVTLLTHPNPPRSPCGAHWYT